MSAFPVVCKRSRSRFQWLGVSFLHGFLASVLVACGVGSGSSDPSSGSQNVVDEQQLAIEITGDTRYRADQKVFLSYIVSGASSAQASISYDGPTELVHDPIAQTLKSDAIPPGTYDIVLTGKSGKYIAEGKLTLFIDANFGGRYVSSNELQILTMGRSESNASGNSQANDGTQSETAASSDPVQTATIFWYAKTDDSNQWIESLCTAEVTVDGEKAFGNGLCKELLSGEVRVFTTLDVLVVYDDAGEVGLSYSYDGENANFDYQLSELRDNYVPTDLDLTGVYRSSIQDGLDYLIIPDSPPGSEISADFYMNDPAQCGINALLERYDSSFITATQGDGSILKLKEMSIDNCDFSGPDQPGYRVAIGEATGSGQSGLLSILQSGISDSVTRFDVYAYRGTDYTDPLSKLRYVRVCYQGLPTSQAEIYDVTEADCEALSGG